MVAKARVIKARVAEEEKALVARVTEVWQEGPTAEVLAVLRVEVETEVKMGEVALGVMMVGVLQAVVRAVQMVVVQVAAEYTAVAMVEVRARVGSERVAAEVMARAEKGTEGRDSEA